MCSTSRYPHGLSGHCGATTTGEGSQCAVTDVQGSWEKITLDECAARCAACSRCAYISYASGDIFSWHSSDCSWYATCQSLQEDDGGEAYWGRGHVTFRIRNSSWEPVAPIAMAALRCFDQKLASLEPIPRVLHTSFKVELPLRPNGSDSLVAVHGLQAFARLNPRWRIEQSTDAQVDAYLQRHLGAADYAVLRRRHIVERSDVWRLLKLWREGGMYTMYTMLCYALLCCAMRCGAVRCCAVRCGAVRCGAVRCGAVLCCAVLCGAVRCGAVRCCAMPVGRA